MSSYSLSRIIGRLKTSAHSRSGEDRSGQSGFDSPLPDQHTPDIESATLNTQTIVASGHLGPLLSNWDNDRVVLDNVVGAFCATEIRGKNEKKKFGESWSALYDELSAIHSSRRSAKSSHLDGDEARAASLLGTLVQTDMAATAKLRMYLRANDEVRWRAMDKLLGDEWAASARVASRGPPEREQEAGVQSNDEMAAIATKDWAKV